MEISTDRIISASKAVREFSSLIDNAQDGPFLIMRRNEPAAVLIGVEAYEELERRLDELIKKFGD